MGIVSFPKDFQGFRETVGFSRASQVSWPGPKCGNTMFSKGFRRSRGRQMGGQEIWPFAAHGPLNASPRHAIWEFYKYLDPFGTIWDHLGPFGLISNANDSQI